MGCTSSSQQQESSTPADRQNQKKNAQREATEKDSSSTTQTSSEDQSVSTIVSNATLESSGHKSNGDGTFKNPLSSRSGSGRVRGLRVEVDSGGSNSTSGAGLTFSPQERSPARAFSSTSLISPPQQAHFSPAALANTNSSSNNSSSGGQRRRSLGATSHWRSRGGGHIPFGSEGAWSQKLSNATTPSNNSLGKSVGTVNSSDEIQIDVTTTAAGSSPGGSSSQGPPGLTQTLNSGHWSSDGTPEDGRSDHSQIAPHILSAASSTSGGPARPEILAGTSMHNLGSSAADNPIASPKSHSGGVRESPLANWLSTVDETASSGRRPSWAMRSIGSQNLDASMGDIDTMSQTECLMQDLHGSMSVRSERRNDAIRCISRGGASWSMGGGGVGTGLAALPEDMSTNAGNDMDEQEALLDMPPEDE